MNFCQNCGTRLEGSKNFCTSCGSAVAMSSATPSYNSPQASYAQGQNQNQGQARNTILDQVQNDNTMLMSVLSYIIFFIPLITGAHKTSETVKFHANQGTVLFIAGMSWFILRFILVAVFSYIPFFGWIISALLSLVWVGFIALHIVGIINAVNNRLKPLPVIGKFSVIK